MVRMLCAALIVGCGCLAPVMAQDTVKLDFKYEENAKLVNHADLKFEQTLGINGMDFETAVEQFLEFTSEVGARAADGKLPIKTSVSKLQVDMQMPGGIALTYDSGNPDKKQQAQIPELDAVLDVFRALSKNHWTMVLNKQNKVVEVKNDGEGLEDLPEAFQSQFDPETRKREANQEMAVIPDKPVQVGDTWERDSTSDFGAGQTMDFHTKYKYEGTVEQDGRRLDKISSEVTAVEYAMEATSASPVTVSSSELSVESSEGTILFDRERGQIVQNDGKTRIKGDLKLSVNGMEIPGTLDLTIAAKTKLLP